MSGSVIVPDSLCPGLILVLCGTAPSRASKEAGAYYAHPGNLFWKSLHETGLTPRRLTPAEYPALLDLGIGLTDLNKREWGADAELSPEGFDVAGFVAKMRACSPRMIAFTSKFAAAKVLARRPLAYGEQDEEIAGARVFVLPSPSGRARRHFDLAPWHALAARVTQER